jgi:hypothetical protein
MIRGFLYSAVAALTVECTPAKVVPPSTVAAGTVIPVSFVPVEDPLSLLAIPADLPIMCREPPPDPAHPTPAGAVLREFRFGAVGPTVIAPWPREITVAFDSAGHIVILSDEVNLGIRGGQSAFAMWGKAGDSTGKVVVVAVDSAALTAATAKGDVAAAQAAVQPPVTRDLSSNEWVRARALGTWLWEGRCGRK